MKEPLKAGWRLNSIETRQSKELLAWAKNTIHDNFEAN